MTNHQELPPIGLTVDQRRLLSANKANPAADPLAELRRRFDERLSALDAQEAGERLRALMAAPGKLHGKVKAGSTS